jgi:YHS domain-containing protein
MRWILALSLLFGGTIAGCSSNNRATPMSDEKAAHLDPVCGKPVDDSTATYKEEYDGKIYYFDSMNCWQKFHDNPHAYLLGGDDRDLKDTREVK